MTAMTAMTATKTRALVHKSPGCPNCVGTGVQVVCRQSRRHDHGGEAGCVLEEVPCRACDGTGDEPEPEVEVDEAPPLPRSPSRLRVYGNQTDGYSVQPASWALQAGLIDPAEVEVKVRRAATRGRWRVTLSGVVTTLISQGATDTAPASAVLPGLYASLEDAGRAGIRVTRAEFERLVLEAK